MTIELLIVFLAALALHYYFRARDVADYDLAELYDRQTEIYEIVMEGKKPATPEDAFKELNKEWSRLDEEYSTGGDFPLKQTALEVTGGMAFNS